jgi:hypothetical protein
MNIQRRAIEARAWLGLGQYDHALEVIQSDKGLETDAIRAEITWKQRQWPGAGGQFEKLLGDRYKAAGPLSAEEEGRLLRAAISYTLAGDDAGLGRLRARYQPFIAQAHQADALRVAMSDNARAQLTASDFARVSAENDSFASWVQAMKQRFRDRPAPTSPTSGLSLPVAGPTPAAPPAAAPKTTTAAANAPSKG